RQSSSSRSPMWAASSPISRQGGAAAKAKPRSAAKSAASIGGHAIKAAAALETTAVSSVGWRGRPLPPTDALRLCVRLRQKPETRQAYNKHAVGLRRLTALLLACLLKLCQRTG